MIFLVPIFIGLVIVVFLVFILQPITKVMKCGHDYKYHNKGGFFSISCRKCVELKSIEIGVKLFIAKIERCEVHIDEIPEQIWENLDYGAVGYVESITKDY